MTESIAPTSPPAAPPIIEYQQPRSHSSLRGRGALAIAGTLIFAGLGHLMAGDRARAGRWAAAMLVCLVLTWLPFAFPSLVPTFIVFGPAQVLFIVFACVSAYKTARRTPSRMLSRPLFRYMAAVLLLILAAIARPGAAVGYYLKANWMEAFRLSTASMSPTIRPGDGFVAHKRAAFGRWNVLVFDSPEMPGSRYVFRLVGFPGEVVEIKQGKVHINEKPVTPPPGLGPYTTLTSNGRPLMRNDGRPGNGCDGNPITLASDEFFVLGDNSPIAGDSRYWSRAAPGHQPGVVPRSNIIGRATWIYWPPSHWRSLEP